VGLSTGRFFGQGFDSLHLHHRKKQLKLQQWGFFCIYLQTLNSGFNHLDQAREQSHCPKCPNITVVGFSVAFVWLLGFQLVIHFKLRSVSVMFKTAPKLARALRDAAYSSKAFTATTQRSLSNFKRIEEYGS